MRGLNLTEIGLMHVFARHGAHHRRGGCVSTARAQERRLPGSAVHRIASYRAGTAVPKGGLSRNELSASQVTAHASTAEGGTVFHLCTLAL